MSGAYEINAGTLHAKSGGAVTVKGSGVRIKATGGAEIACGSSGVKLNSHFKAK